MVAVSIAEATKEILNASTYNPTPTRDEIPIQRPPPPSNCDNPITDEETMELEIPP